MKKLEPILPIIALWALWESLTLVGILPGHLLPPPSKIVTALANVLVDGSLLYHTGQSLKRALAAYVLAALLAIPIGLVLGWFSRLYRMFEITVEILRPIPAIALIPFGILVLGLGDFSKIFIITYASFFVLFINTLYGALNVDEVLLLSLRSLKATDSYIFRKVLIHAASPYIFAGLRQCIAVSLIVMVAVEMIYGGNGLGFFILESEQTFRVPQMYAGILFIGILGYISTKIFLIIEGRFLRWYKRPDIS